MDKEAARERAAQAWCTENTSHIEMNPDLAEAFTDILLTVYADSYREGQDKGMCETRIDSDR